MSCFDRISHDWLLAHIPMDKAILQKWLKAGFMEKHVLYPTEAGYAARWHLLTRAGQPDAGRPGTDAAGTLSRKHRAEADEPR